MQNIIPDWEGMQQEGMQNIIPDWEGMQQKGMQNNKRTKTKNPSERDAQKFTWLKAKNAAGRHAGMQSMMKRLIWYKPISPTWVKT